MGCLPSISCGRSSSEPAKGLDRKARLGFTLVLAAVGLVAQWVWIHDYVVVTTRIDGTFP